MTPASRTEPPGGAPGGASGSQGWNGHIGTLMAKPRNTPAQINTCTLFDTNPAAPACWVSCTMSNVWGFDLKNMARNPSSMKTLPNSVYRKNLIEAYSRLAEPHTAIRKYMGTRTSSQKMKNRTRSNAMNVPAMPVSSSIISARNAFGLPGLGRNLQV